jgi:hypothetical protein
MPLRLGPRCAGVDAYSAWARVMTAFDAVVERLSWLVAAFDNAKRSHCDRAKWSQGRRGSRSDPYLFVLGSFGARCG